jgi:hypothetical protein
MLLVSVYFSLIQPIHPILWGGERNYARLPHTPKGLLAWLLSQNVFASPFDGWMPLRMFWAIAPSDN